MLYWTAIFFVITLLAAIFGFTGIAAKAAGILTVLFFICLALFVIAGLSALYGRHRIANEP